MNPETKEFQPVTEDRPAPPEWPVFRVGDRFTINGVEMAVRKITRKDVILRPVKGSGR